MRREIVATGLAVLLGAACVSSPDLAAARAALMEADRAFARATAERGVEGWVEYFAADGAMTRPGGVIVGPDSIRAFMTPTFADTSFALTWEPERAVMGGAGDLGYTIGRWQTRGRNQQGQVMVRAGTYLTVWRKQPDGSWKVEMDIGSPDGPAAPQP